MRKRTSWVAVPVGTALAAALLSGCGSEDGSGGSGGSLVMGMTDKVLSVDPASGYDPGSWLVFNNVFQPLLSFPKGGGEPQPEAAEKCGFQDGASKVFSCTLRKDLKFSNGNDLTSKDVKHSFERTLRIDDADGPAVMLHTIKEIETPDERTVVFRLNTSDATFPQKIASGAGSIVDHREYPADALRKDGKAIGSGVYTLDSYDSDKADFSVNSGYTGPAEARNSGMTMKFFDDQEALRKALTDREVDLAYRGLATKDIAELEMATTREREGVQIVQGTSAQLHHLVFNVKHPQVSDVGVRRAVAHLIDRSSLIRDVYRRTAEPLYSVVPAGITGHNTAFFDRYGERPDRTKAQAALRSAGIEGKAKLTLYSPPERYGPDTTREMEAIAKQLNASGLFEAQAKVVELERYEKDVAAGKYPVYVRGWIPDYPDPDNFVDPFFGKDSILGNGYESGRIAGELLPRTAAQSNRAQTVEDFGAIQDQIARDVPVLPIWQGRQYAVARDGVAGLEWTLDASTVFRFWELSKS
ncbi:ABC transporter substrate-binding protein [Streptomyces sp. OF3]|uniref:ABC transporter substrate-binding protein n=1 Tax=Streptomyces alkaliterrae TaxID=2213162 RepID=A0A7W3ZKZ8_9ACTN|nr:ABC transporter substrate-binding protein [Streptomyces alkaliterrae]MBB1252193.1 ABC transporter substrate-binding protein [Streptomyces alkaliterrae]